MNRKPGKSRFTDFFQPFQQVHNSFATPPKTNTIPKMLPLEQFNSPHYEIQILTEDPSNKKEWAKYSRFFDKPFQLKKTVPVVKIDYNTVKNISSTQKTPNRFIQPDNIDTILKSLYGKDHIVVLNPRNCDSKRKKKYQLKPLDKLDHDDIDNLVDNILEFIDRDEKYNVCPCQRNYGLLYPDNAKNNACNCKKKQMQLHQNIFENNKVRKRSCDESYLFYLTNLKNSWQDLVMRILPISQHFNKKFKE